MFFPNFFSINHRSNRQIKNKRKWKKISNIIIFSSLNYLLCFIINKKKSCTHKKLEKKMFQLLKFSQDVHILCAHAFNISFDMLLCVDSYRIYNSNNTRMCVMYM